MAFNWNPFRRRQSERNTRSESSGVQNNPNYKIFNKINNDIAAIVNSRSIIQRAIQNQQNPVANPTWSMSFGEDFLAIPVTTNKQERINMYRSIASYPLCKWCLEEIADDFIHEDENGDFIILNLPERLNTTQQDIIQNEFKKYMNLFQLRNNGFNIVKRFLIEGELAWENIINPNYPQMGIIGVRFLPAEYYELLIDTQAANPIGLVFDTDRFVSDQQQVFSNNFVGSAAIFNSMTNVSYSYHLNSKTSVPVKWEQLTYINSGDYSYDQLISYPLIENVKQEYHRLALLEDSCVILRVTHAPERLLFNVSTGKMTQNYADEYVRRFAMDLKSKKVSDQTGDIHGVYNPVTMLKSYVFGKSDGNDGTSVESVGSSASYDQMEDVEYFLRALLKQFKIPWARYKTPENTIEKNDAITYEEYAFSRMIIRFQRRFAEGFKRGFITHLKLKEIWDKDNYELMDSDINIEFVKPVLYDMYQTQKLVDAKMTIYKAFADQEELSKTLMMKKYLGYSDHDIEENYRYLIKDKQLIAVGDYFAEQISEENPPVDFKSPIRLKKDIDAAEKINSNIPEKSDADGDENGNDENTENEENNDEESIDVEASDAEPSGKASFGL